MVEILSEGNQKYDRNDKKNVYEAVGVREYWVVDPKTKWCEGFILENGAYKSLGAAYSKLTIQMLDLEISF